MTEVADYKVQESIAFFEIRRPGSSNSLDAAVLKEIDAALDRAAADPDVKALVFQGSGSGFCSGYDLASNGYLNVKRHDIMADWSRLQVNSERWERVFSFPKATVARVHGYALAGGFELAMACDFVVATESAKFGHPGVRGLGVPPFLIFPQVLGHRGSRDLLLTGKSVRGDEALRRGWVTQAVADDQLDAAVDSVLTGLRAMPMDNIRLMKRLLLRADSIMGHRAVREMGVEFDTVAHRGQAAAEFWQDVEDHGLRSALHRRDEPYED